MKFPKYVEFRQTGRQPITCLPSHWELRRLRFVAGGIEQGWSPQCDNLPADDDAWGVMKVGCVNGTGFDAGENKALPPELEPLTEYALRAGDLLVSRANTRDLVGSAALVPADVRPKLLLCDKLFRLNALAGIHPRYLVYVLRAPIARFHYERDATGASGSMQNIGQDTLKDVLVPLPSDDEQEHIANFLDWKTGQIDALIAKKKTLVNALDEQRRALTLRAVVGNVESGRGKTGWFGKLRREWPVRRVKFIGRVGNGSTPTRDDGAYWDGGTYPWLNSSVVNQDEVTEADQFVTATALKECHLPKIEPPAILLGITGQGRTRGMAATLRFEATINQHIAFVKPDPSVVDVDFLRAVFDAAYLYLRSESDGGGSTKGAITCEQIAELPVPVPTLEEQREIAVQLRLKASVLDRMRMKATVAISSLTEYRSALITAAVTGQIDVRGVNVPVPA